MTETGVERTWLPMRWSASTIALTFLLLAGCALGAPPPVPIDPALDARIRAEVEARLAAEPSIGADRVRVEVRGGRVQLHGSVDGISAWNCALRTASLVEDVRSVIEFLVIERGPPEVTCLAPRGRPGG